MAKALTEELLAAIAANAAAADRNGTGLAADIARLAGAGVVVAALPATLSGQDGWGDDPAKLAAVLRRLGRASLPVGRLIEGHANAGQLIGLYGTPTLRAATTAAVGQGALLGVWGANGEWPVTAKRDGDGFILDGVKAFCSGLGIVRTAVISAGIDAGTQLFAVDVTDMGRADPATWDMSGMRATASGDYDFDRLPVAADAAVGQLNDFFVEPYFLGGMYRMAAVQVGGIEALLAAMIDAVRGRGQADDPVQQLRLGSAGARLAMARAAVERLAAAVAAADPHAVGEAPTDPAIIATLAIVTREAVEQCAVGVMTLAERAASTAAFRTGSDLDRIRRDVGLYLRQAAVDVRLSRAGAALVAGGLAAAGL